MFTRQYATEYTTRGLHLEDHTCRITTLIFNGVDKYEEKLEVNCFNQIATFIIIPSHSQCHDFISLFSCYQEAKTYTFANSTVRPKDRYGEDVHCQQLLLLYVYDVRKLCELLIQYNAFYVFIFD